MRRFVNRDLLEEKHPHLPLQHTLSRKLCRVTLQALKRGRKALTNAPNPALPILLVPPGVFKLLPVAAGSVEVETRAGAEGPGLWSGLGA